TDVVETGAGAVGTSVALARQAPGRRLQGVDGAGVGPGASAAPAGAFAFADIEPLATPGIMRKAPRWLFDPLGPLSIPLGYAPKIAPWLWRFWRASRPDRYAEAVSAQARLMTLSRDALERQIVDVDGERLVQRDGQLQLYEGEAAFRASLPSWDARRRAGVAFRLLETAEAIAEIQPGLHPRFTHAGFTPDWMNAVDPRAWTDHLAAVFRARGGVVSHSDVRAIAPRTDGVSLATAEGSIDSAQVVVAAGAWSHHLARTLGDRIPLETERGYNTTLPAGAFDLRTHLTFGAHGFVVTRINGGVRIGGAVELGGLDRAPDYRRAQVLLAKAAGFLPGLKVDGGVEWMGFRPSLPDSLPAIGPSPHAPRVVYAFGHGHLGLTQATGTAELVRDIVIGAAPATSLNPYSPARF
ncbi:MAG: FAD-dependent oxidoreductase, partial [Pseudomonadota bacterium]